MPLEISEIGVHFAVGDPAAPADPAGRPGPAPEPGCGGGGSLSAAQTSEIVERCVAAVLARLRLREAR
jgi:hypothetical protein